MYKVSKHALLIVTLLLNVIRLNSMVDYDIYNAQTLTVTSVGILFFWNP